ncbi:MAG: Latex clearing protein precursor [Algoriphagus sp.]|nr:Latex clearing protein precursor [Algoriphagus sp.]
MDKLKLYTNSNFQALRGQGDLLADEAVKSLVAKPEWIEIINSWEEIPEEIPEIFDSSVQKYFNFFNSSTDHYDLEVLKKGQLFFEKKGDSYLGMLGFYSLPYCYAFADGAEVLVRSNRIVNQIGERLGETAVFLMDIFAPGAFYEDKKAILTCAKVRLTHAFSRYFVEAYAKDWDPKFGKPVNQEDMLGTNLAFSYIVLRGLIKMGRRIDREESEAILAYWKWIGYLIGLETKNWPNTAREAIEVDRLIRKRQLRASTAGQQLIQALITYYKKSIPEPLLTERVEDILYFFLGKEASDALGIVPKNQLEGGILGLIFQYSGWKSYGGKKSYASIRRMMEQQQKEQFGKVMKIQLPARNRS